MERNDELLPVTATEHITALLEKYRQGTIAITELKELIVWVNTLSESEKAAIAVSYEPLWEKAKEGSLPSKAGGVDWEGMLKAITENKKEATEKPAPAFRLLKQRWMKYAAAILLVVFCAIAYQRLSRTEPKPVVAAENVRMPEQVFARGNSATLTLADGSIVNLDSAVKGVVANQGATAVTQISKGELAYQPSTNNSSPVAGGLYNTIATPRGGQYQLTLPDGTKVWLNAASSLHYPVAFTGKDRTVKLTGEAYFEVAKNKQIPFYVVCNDVQVKVLGTHFNIMAYSDEDQLQATLLEGSIQFSQESEQVILMPGQQARTRGEANATSLPKKTAIEVIREANVQQAVAWKNGYFQFDKSNLKTILRQVSRWYDLDIVYKGLASEDLFSGKIERNLPLSGILHLLQKGNIKFKLEGKTLVIAP